MRIIGLMSGTSADGIDAALTTVQAARGGRIAAHIDAFICRPFAPGLRARVLGVHTLDDLCRLNFELGEAFADAALAVCRKARVAPGCVDAIGSHGQTVWHVAGGPARSTLQIGEPSIIAERTGITTVADFRPRDIAAGGCGAPLVPIVDRLLLASPSVDRVALNIGGIANITVLPRSGAADLAAFDTGPGNMVIDALAAHFSRGRDTCDRGGRLAARGRVIEPLLESLLADRYYTLAPPKSTGRETYGAAFVRRILARARRRPAADVIATATALTARTIADAVRRSLPDRRRIEIIASGGGVHNITLMRMLQRELPHARLIPSGRIGIPADAKEALAFAILAYLTLSGRPGNVPSATGAARPVVLGKIVPGNRFSLGKKVQ